MLGGSGVDQKLIRTVFPNTLKKIVIIHIFFDQSKETLISFMKPHYWRHKDKIFFFFLQIHHGLQGLLIGLRHRLQHEVEVSQPGQQFKHRHFTRCHVPASLCWYGCSAVPYVKRLSQLDLQGLLDKASTVTSCNLLEFCFCQTGFIIPRILFIFSLLVLYMQLIHFWSFTRVPLIRTRSRFEIISETGVKRKFKTFIK